MQTVQRILFEECAQREERAGARYVAILGDDGTALKDMETGEQKTVETETVMHHIRGGL